ncbi:MAG: asparaginase [Vicinamibacteraceae bacterium]
MTGATGRRLLLLLLFTGLTNGLALTAGPVPAAAQALPRVRLVATGGTIANRTGARLTPAELVRLAPTIDRHARVDVEAFANVSSGQLTLEQWLQLAKRVSTILAEEADCAGVVVSSGTDTLEELAYFLHLTVRSDKPVVVVGSMRPPDAVVFDGAANLVAAVRVAAAVESRGRGTLVVMNEEIHGARDVTKTDAQRLDAFQSHGGRLGVVDADRVVYARRTEKRGGAQSEFDIQTLPALPRVDVLLTYQGAPGDLIRAAVDNGAAGIVLATAAGGTSGTQLDAVRYAIGRRVVVVSATRTGLGRVVPVGEPGRVLATAGTLAADDLTPIKARILLMLALARAADPRDIQRMLREY